MIQFHFKQLLADKEFKEKLAISILGVAEKTELSRVTLFIRLPTVKGITTPLLTTSKSSVFILPVPRTI